MMIGIILLNLGGPDSLEAVKPFLLNLFSDRQIIRLGPSFLQKPLARLISTIRSRKTVRYYSLIGGKSPIFDITKAQAKALEKALNNDPIIKKQESNPSLPPFAKGRNGGNTNSEFRILNSELNFRVYIGMRYWHPFIEDVVPLIDKDGIKNLIPLSLYPHYSVTTTGSSLSKLKEVIAGYNIKTIGVPSWHNHPLYIEALVDVIKRGLKSFDQESGASIAHFSKGGQGGITNSELDIHVLFSAHSLPQKIIDAGDPYVDQTTETIREIIKIIPMKWHLSYQSKSGPVQWLEPSTEDKIRELAGQGVKNILVVPISFVSDHIETLYEIDILYKDFSQKLGVRLMRTDSLNTHPKFIEALKDIVMKSIPEKLH